MYIFANACMATYLLSLTENDVREASLIDCVDIDMRNHT